MESVSGARLFVRFLENLVDYNLVVGVVMVWWMKFDGYEKTVIKRRAEIKRELRSITLDDTGRPIPRVSTAHRLNSSASAESQEKSPLL